jgi:alpha-amylase/alpha-mannosidase (GH57 family)
MKHEKVKFGIHNSGTLLEWISKMHPEYFEMLRELVQRGQVEILSSAYAEPILSLIPKRDAIDQIKYFNDYIYKNFSFSPKGLWLTERIWEPGLIPILFAAGIEYTLLDNTIFLSAGLNENELYSYYLTEDNGSILKIFPISTRLRYLIPFQHIDKTVAFLKVEDKRKNRALVTFGDDGEKFGVWPGTKNWVYKQGWLKKLLSRIENETWIETAHLHQIVSEPAAGRIYLPTASYEEMGEWTLPPDVGIRYEEMKRKVNKKYYSFMPGGYFKNFLRKYPEANLLHKRMLYVSNKMNDDIDAKLALWRGQCSCAYWHGIFGGLYLPHLREAVYRNLIEADNLNIKKELQSYDFDVDGEKEIIFSNEDFFFVLKPKSASFIEIDDRKRKINILNYLGRRKEKYHHNIPRKMESSEVKSIHEIFRSKEKNLIDHLIYDRYERSFGLDHLLDSTPTKKDFCRGEKMGKLVVYTKYDVLDKQRCIIKFSGQIEKIIELSKTNSRSIQLKYKGDVNRLGVEFPLGIFSKKVILNRNKSLFKSWNAGTLNKFTVKTDKNIPITFTANKKFSLLTYPIETISSSESGFERIFQGFGLLLIFTKLPTIWIEL